MKKLIELIKNNKLTVVLYSISFIIIALIVISITYAYLQAQISPDIEKPLDIDIASMNDLTFSGDSSFSMSANPETLPENGDNLVDTATAVATLTDSGINNSETYSIYLDITSNPLVRTHNEDAEVLLNVYLNNVEVPLTGLTQVTSCGATGYDITTKHGLINVGDHTISVTAGNGNAVDTWTFKITYLNLETDQSANYGASIAFDITLSLRQRTFCEINTNDIACYLASNYDASTMATGTDNLIYYHDSNLTYGANDEGYRYSGANPNNWVCFGSDAASCPAENLYRIIGVVPVDVVTDATTNPITTEEMYLYKIVRNDFATENDMDLTKGANASKANPFAGPTNNQPSGDIPGFYWSGSSSNTSNTWADSSIRINLNNHWYNSLGSTWQAKIANVMWKVGGNTSGNTISATPMSTTYTNEITNPVTNNTTDSKTELAGKIGLIYVTDYGYGAPQSAWEHALTGYNNEAITPYNWMYRGVFEFTLTRRSDTANMLFTIRSAGMMNSTAANTYPCGMRITFYLNPNTLIDRTLHTGTISDPYRIS